MLIYSKIKYKNKLRTITQSTRIFTTRFSIDSWKKIIKLIEDTSIDDCMEIKLVYCWTEDLSVH